MPDRPGVSSESHTRSRGSVGVCGDEGEPLRTREEGAALPDQRKGERQGGQRHARRKHEGNSREKDAGKRPRTTVDRSRGSTRFLLRALVNGQRAMIDDKEQFYSPDIFEKYLFQSEIDQTHSL